MTKISKEECNDIGGEWMHCRRCGNNWCYKKDEIYASCSKCKTSIRTSKKIVYEEE